MKSIVTSISKNININLQRLRRKKLPILQTHNSNKINSIGRRYLCVATNSETVSDGGTQLQLKKTESTPSSAPVSEEDEVLEKSTKTNIEDPTLIFKRAWNKLVEERGLSNMRFPGEIIFLMGAPGSGKGTNTPFILRERGITAEPIVMSDLLKTPEHEEIKRKAGLASDYEVVTLLLNKLLEPQYQKGCVVDGFPRTPAQVGIVKQLYDHMLDLRKKFQNTEIAHCFPRPTFRVTVLFVDENLSVARQLERGRKVRMHNEKIRRTGFGKLIPERPTDYDEERARERYAIFAKNYDTLKTLREHFTFNIIPATSSIKEVEKEIVKEFAYQSKLELDSKTFDAIQKLPTSREIILHSRQKMVERLDNYAQREKELFDKVVSILETEFYPQISLHSLSGKCIIRTNNPVFHNPSAIAIAIDILAERGFQAICDSIDHLRPVRIEKETFNIITEVEKKYIFHVKFKRPIIRHESQT